MSLLTGETQKVYIISKINHEPILEIQLDNFLPRLYRHNTEGNYLMVVGCFWKHASIPEHLRLIFDEVITELWETPGKKIVCYYRDKYYCYWCNSNIFQSCSLEKTVRLLPIQHPSELEKLGALMEKDYKNRKITNRHNILDYDLTDTVSEINEEDERRNQSAAN